MLRDELYQFPLAAAQRQYRTNYYGMTSAALLEVVFVDALERFLRSRPVGVDFKRAPPGEKSWDYQFNGHRLSHKVAKGGDGEITVLWDATVKADRWTVDNSIIFHTNGYKPRTISANAGGVSFRLRSLDGDPNQTLKPGHQVIAVSWGDSDRGEVQHSWAPRSNEPVAKQLSPASAWNLVVRPIDQGVAANHLELFEVMRNLSGDESWAIQSGCSLALDYGLRPGVYLIPKSRLVDIPVKGNNRGLQIAAPVVNKLLKVSMDDGLFVAMPTWWGAFADERPPDLFQPQRRQFDDIFSRGG